jgi:hypothetical protein
MGFVVFLVSKFRTFVLGETESVFGVVVVSPS